MTKTEASLQSLQTSVRLKSSSTTDTWNGKRPTKITPDIPHKADTLTRWSLQQQDWMKDKTTKSSRKTQKSHGVLCGKELRSHQPSQRRPGTEPFPGLTTKSRSRVSQEETFYLHCRRARVLKERRIHCAMPRYNWRTQLRERAKKVAKEVLHGSCLSKRRGLSQSNQRKINRTSANYRKISWDEALEKWLCSWRAWQFWHLRREKRRWMSCRLDELESALKATKKHKQPGQLTPGEDNIAKAQHGLRLGNSTSHVIYVSAEPKLSCI